MRDTAIESSVVTKVKGFGRYANRVMDVSDYVTPPQVWPPYVRLLCRCSDPGQVGGADADRIPTPDSVASVVQSSPSPAAGG